MKISILLSTYNGEKYLNELFDSIYKQEGNFEILLCIRDDGSNDNTLKIIESWKTKLNIILSKGHNLGPKNSFRELIVNAPISDYYAFCDQDDIWHTDKLVAAVNALEKEKHDKPILYYCNASLIDCEGNMIKDSRDDYMPMLKYENLIVQNPALGCEMVFDEKLRDLMKKVTFDFYYMHDVIAIELAALTGKIIYDSVPRMDYRQHIASVTQGHDKVKRFLDRIDFWFFKKNISISLQAKELILLFPLSKDREILEEISYYKKGFNRFFLVIGKKYRSTDYRCNRSFIIRVLLGVA